jgi:hypothetical protein
MAASRIAAHAANLIFIITAPVVLRLSQTNGERQP